MEPTTRQGNELGELGTGAGVELSEALEALRSALSRAAYHSRGERVRFRPEQVELTINVGVTLNRKGSGGIKWHVLSLGGERSKEDASTQTLTVRLVPVLFDDHGNPLPESEQLVSDTDDEPSHSVGAPRAGLGGEPE